jgi:hypothetical protein
MTCKLRRSTPQPKAASTTAIAQVRGQRQTLATKPFDADADRSAVGQLSVGRRLQIVRHVIMANLSANTTSAVREWVAAVTSPRLRTARLAVRRTIAQAYS